VKLDPHGNHIRSRTVGGPGWDTSRALAADPFGNVLLTGGFTDTIDLDGTVLFAQGQRDIFVTKIDSSGDVVWGGQLGSPGEFDQDYGRSVAVDASGNVVITGRFEGSLDVGRGPEASAGGRDIFLAKINPDGDALWGRVFGGAADDNVRDVSVNAAGEVVLTGSFGAQIDFGGGALTSAGDHDVFVARFDAGGQHLWSKRLGETGYQTGTAVTWSPAGQLAIAGEFYGSVDLGGGPLVEAGDGDLFLVMLTP
jgi:hypothetical protein